MEGQESSQILISELSRSKEKGELEGLQYFSSLIDELKKHNVSFDSESVHDLILKMSIFCDANYETSVDEICATFIDKCCFQLIYHFVKDFVDKDDLSNKTLQTILKWLISLSGHSERFVIELDSSEVLELLVDMMLNSFHQFTSMFQDTYKTFEMCVNILYNVYRNCYTFIQYKDKELKRLLVEFIKKDCDTNLTVLSMLTLSYIVKEKEIGLLDEGSNIIGKLIKKIKLINEKGISIDGFTLNELLHGLHHISSNDKMRERIEAEGGLPILIKILKDIDENDVKPILGVFENLCLNEEIKIKLVQDYYIEETFNRFKNNPRKNIKKKLENILYKIKEKSNQKEEKEISNRKYDYDIFISYSWDDKEKVFKIVDELKKFNFRIWIDKEQLGGISLETIENGISESQVFIMFYSSSYENSSNCYNESMYAYDIGKTIIPVVVEFMFKPERWLKSIVNQKRYYNFSGLRDPKEEMQKMIEEIRLNLEKEAVTAISVIDEMKEKLVSNQNKKNMKADIYCRQCDFDIFLSYSSENKQQVSEIVENLNLCGFRVWIDKNQIKGYSIKAIANGIGNSRLFIMVISTSYELSSNCYHEAIYAFHKKKPIIPVIVELNYKPKNWLAFIIGSKVYYEISGRKDFKKEMEKLKEEIDSYSQKDIVSQTAMMEGNNVDNIF